MPFAFIAFVVAAVIFVVRALGGSIDEDWGLFVLAVGLALAYLPGGWVNRA